MDSRPSIRLHENNWALQVRYNRGQEERMQRIPLTKEGVMPQKMVLKFEKVGLTEEQFFRLCSDNGDLFMELTAQKELIIMPPVGVKTGWRESILVTRLTNWAEKDGTGIVCGPDTLFKLPNTAIRGPDSSWIRKEKLNAFTEEELEKFGQFCPDFVAEIMSPSNTLKDLQEKMAEYMANGAQLGWLIDPYEAVVYISRPGEPVSRLENPISINGDPVLPGFVFNVAEIW
jgi:Uma2 family endonuclease